MEIICKCKVCNRKFIYGDCQSPMLNTKIWKQVITFYNLAEYEEKAIERYVKHYDKAGIKLKHIEDEHLYICYTCMENALGRKIRRRDLIGKNMPFNEAFEYMYFNR